jgi:hypothetical protein
MVRTLMSPGRDSARKWSAQIMTIEQINWEIQAGADKLLQTCEQLTNDRDLATAMLFVAALALYGGDRKAFVQRARYLAEHLVEVDSTEH